MKLVYMKNLNITGNVLGKVDFIALGEKVLQPIDIFTFVNNLILPKYKNVSTSSAYNVFLSKILHRAFIFINQDLEKHVKEGNVIVRFNKGKTSMLLELFLPFPKKAFLKSTHSVYFSIDNSSQDKLKNNRGN